MLDNAENKYAPIEEENNSLKNNILTDEMLSKALFSLSKKAKHFKIEGNKKEEERMYKLKDVLLSTYLKPVEVHKEYHGYEKIIHTSEEKNYLAKLLKALIHRTIPYTICANGIYKIFYNYKEFTENNMSKPIIKYYLYYIHGYKSYHYPILTDLQYEFLPHKTIMKIGSLKFKNYSFDTTFAEEVVRKTLSEEIIFIHDSNYGRNYYPTKQLEDKLMIDNLYKERIENTLQRFVENSFYTYPCDKTFIREMINWQRSRRYKNRQKGIENELYFPFSEKFMNKVYKLRQFTNTRILSLLKQYHKKDIKKIFIELKKGYEAFLSSQ